MFDVVVDKERNKLKHEGNLATPQFNTHYTLCCQQLLVLVL